VLFSFSALLTDGSSGVWISTNGLMWSPIEKVLYGFSSTTMAFFAPFADFCALASASWIETMGPASSLPIARDMSRTARVPVPEGDHNSGFEHAEHITSCLLRIPVITTILVNG
jgi:hypothetical protein